MLLCNIDVYDNMRTGKLTVQRHTSLILNIRSASVWYNILIKTFISKSSPAQADEISKREH